MNRVFKLLTISLALGPVWSAGCSSSHPSGAGGGFPQSDVFAEVAGMLREYLVANRRGPAKVADLAPYENTYPYAYQAIKSGDIEVVWGAVIAGEGGGGSDAVIAYEKKVPAEGGYVLLENGKIKEMKAAEFQSAPKAQKR
jgi:hypothetical protein